MAGILHWDMGDGSIIDSNSFSHKYANTVSTKTIQVYKGTAVGAGDITQINITSDDLVGTLDVSNLINLTNLTAYNNRKLTSIIIPDTSSITYFRVSDCSLSGVIDVSKLSKLSVRFDVANNIKITGILNPSTNELFTDGYFADRCDLTGVLDLRPIRNLGGSSNAYLSLYYNRKLTQILLPDSSQLFGTFYINDCSLSGTLDLSALTGLGGSFRVENNINLTKIINPTNSRPFTNYTAQNCKLTGTIDLTTLTGLGGAINLTDNPLLNYVLNPTTTQNFTQYAVGGTSSIKKGGLIGTLDISSLSGLGGVIAIEYCPSLNYIKFPTSTNTITVFSLSSDNLTGTLDVSGLSGLGGIFYVRQNRNLNYALFPYSTQYFRDFYMDDCNLFTLDLSGLVNLGSNLTGQSGRFILSGNNNLQQLKLPTTLNANFYLVNCTSCSLDTQSIDELLTKFYNRWNNVLPTYHGNIFISQNLNSPPTDGSSNENISKIKNIFDNSTAWDVSILINYGPTELLKFDGSVFLKSNTSLAPPSASDYRISFDCYMDTSTGIGTGTSVMVVLGGTNNMAVRFISDTSIQYYYGSTVKQCPIFLPKQKNHIDFYYNGASAAGDVSLYVNGVIQSKVNAGTGSSGGTTWIGGWDSVSWTNVHNFTLWNLDLNGEHFYKGEPSGNTPTAWEDTVGTVDLSLMYPAGIPPSKRYAVLGQFTT